MSLTASKNSPLPYLLASTGTLLVGSLIFVLSHPQLELRYPFMHASIEALGSFLAGIIAWHLFTVSQINPRDVFRVWIAFAFLSMGVLDGFHALAGPGEAFVWFHSCSAFMGGLLSLLVWIPARVVPRLGVGWGLWLCVVAYPLFGISSVWYPQAVPQMIDQQGFSLVARILNLSGGVAFVGTSLWFLRNYWQHSRSEYLLYASCFVLIGASAVMFEMSTLWDPIWWWWHCLRLLSYGLVAYHAKEEFERGLISHGRANAREEENMRFRLVVESAPCGMLMVNHDGIMTLVNKHIETLFGYDRQELIGQPIERLIPVRFRCAHPGLRQDFFQAPTVRAMGEGRELFGLRKDGTEFPVEVGLNPIESSSGGHQVLATVVDISERKRMGRQVRLSEFSVNHVSVPTLWVAPDAKVFRVNQATCKMMGYTEEELLGMTVHDFNPDFPADFWPAHWQDLKVKGHMIFESGIRHKDGHLFPVEMWVNFLAFEGQEYNIAFVTDITDRKQVQEHLAQQAAELSRSNDELEQFAYVASHDLQEPLRMVSSYCGLLARRYQGKLDQDADEFIQFAVDGAKRMKDLINDLLQYSRTGRRGKPFVPTNSTEIVQVAMANLEIAIREADALVTCDPLPRVCVDSVQLIQVFQNLIGNALKFRADRRPTIHISVRCLSESNDPSQCVFSVQDNGIGFEEQYNERVFTIFQRLHTREEYPGNGMGLAITKKIIERHGGRIWVESIPGKGTTFFFTLRGQPSESMEMGVSGSGLSK